MKKSNFKGFIITSVAYFVLMIIFIPTYTQAQSSYIDEISVNVIQIETESSLGSGLIIPVDDTLYIFTNRHVVEGYYNFKINVLEDVNETVVHKFNADLIAYSKDFDFALLRIDTDVNGNKVLASHYSCRRKGISICYDDIVAEFDTSLLRRGDEIGVLGYPGIGSDELIYTSGRISSLKFEEYNGSRKLVWIRTNAEMAPGNSGGVAFNSDGKIIGIPTYVMSESVTGGRLGNILSFDIILSSLENPENMYIEWDEEGSIAGELDYNLEPEYGFETLVSQSNDGIIVREVIGGGYSPVDELNSSCVGYTDTNPDFRLQWSGQTDYLIFMFRSSSSSDDATIIVNDPNGEWHCNDDAFDDNMNPGLMVRPPLMGQYDIWIGSYARGEVIDGELVISDGLDDDTQNQINDDLDLDADPVYGTQRLSAGFLPDPHTVDIMAGGNVKASFDVGGSTCEGYFGSAPDYRIYWSGSTDKLVFSFTSDISSDDTVLIINNPDAKWYCDDDTNSLNPQIQLSRPVPGRYDIWIGSYAADEFIDGKLKVSELE